MSPAKNFRNETVMKSVNKTMKLQNIGVFSLLAALSLGTVTEGHAEAALRKAGTWPKDEKKVSLDVKHVSVDEALEQLADKAGWSLVIPEPLGGTVTLHVRDERADRVLEAIFAEGNLVATRDGGILRVARDAEADSGATKVVETKPDAAPAATKTVETDPPASEQPSDAAGPDRMVKGQSLRIEKGETVHDVSVFGGAVDVYGKVTGDLVVTGGSARIHAGALIKGDATAIGGSMHVEDGARIEGDVGVVGGALTRGERSVIKGDVNRSDKADQSGTRVSFEHDDPPKTFLHRARDGFGHALSSFATLFVLGAVFLALAGRRVEMLRLEVATRPMRNFALGIVGLLGFVTAFVVLCVTVIGLPLALVGFCLGLLAMLAGVVSVAQVGGELLLRHRTQNPYAHLALGCFLLVALGSIPVVGGFVWSVVGFMAIGTLVATRVAGFMAKKGTAAALPSQGPYRSDI